MGDDDCMMRDHVHLLLTPGESTTRLSQLSTTLAGRDTRYRTRVEWRSGTLWVSRYKSSVVQTDTYLMACSRYIELNPVRARLCAEPGDYPWSSYRGRISENVPSDWLDTDPCFLALGADRGARRERYAAFVKQAIPEEETRLIRDALQRGQLTGCDRFVEEIERIAGLRSSGVGRGGSAVRNKFAPCGQTASDLGLALGCCNL